MGVVYLDPDSDNQLVLIIKRSSPLVEDNPRQETMYLWWNIPLRIIEEGILFEGWFRNYFQLSSPTSIRAAMEMVRSYVVTNKLIKFPKTKASHDKRSFTTI